MGKSKIGGILSLRDQNRLLRINNKMSNEQQSYRDLLQELSIKSQDQYDKTLLTLSTGALGLSFAFIKDIVNISVATNINYLTGSWISLTFSILCILISFLSAKHALDKAIEAEDNDEVYESKLDRITSILNWMSAAFFIAGLIFVTVFIKLNLGV